MMIDLCEAKEIPDLDLGEEAKRDCGAHWTRALFACINYIRIFHVLMIYVCMISVHLNTSPVCISSQLQVF